jgi:hypothetical protein
MKIMSTGGVAQVAEYMPNKLQALSASLSTQREKEETQMD